MGKMHVKTKLRVRWSGKKSKLILLRMNYALSIQRRPGMSAYLHEKQ